MTPPSPPRASPLTLPAAVLHPPDPPPHPDSEESVQYECRRVAQELAPIHELNGCDPISSHRVAAAQSEGEVFSSYPTILTRRRSVRTSPDRETFADGGLCGVSTAPDSQGPDAHNARPYRLRRQARRWYDPIVRFWTTEVTVTIDEGSHRDHLALERTFLGYLRTSAMLSMTGVIVAQLFRLQHSVSPNLHLGFYVVGVPFASSLIGMAIFVLLVGAYRFWKQQRAIIRGKVYAGGWEISLIMLLSILLCMAFFVVTTAIDIERSY